MFHGWISTEILWRRPARDRGRRISRKDADGKEPRKLVSVSWRTILNPGNAHPCDPVGVHYPPEYRVLPGQHAGDA